MALKAIPEHTHLFRTTGVRMRPEAGGTPVQSPDLCRLPFGPVACRLEATFPVARSAVGMGDGEDLHDGRKFAIDQSKRKTMEEKSASTSAIPCPTMGCACDELDGSRQFLGKFRCGLRAARKIPVQSIFVLRIGLFVEANRLSGHASVWPKRAGGLLPRVWSLPCRNRGRQCGGRFLHSTQLRQLRDPRVAHRGFQGASPPAAPALRQRA